MIRRYCRACQAAHRLSQEHAFSASSSASLTTQGHAFSSTTGVPGAIALQQLRGTECNSTPSLHPHGSRAQSQWSWAGLASGLAMTGGILGLTATLAQADTPNSAGLHAAQDLLRGTWSEVSMDVARLNARLPSRVPSLKCQEPSVATAGPGGKWLEVTVPLRQGADTDAVLRDMQAAFEPSSAGPGVSSVMRSRSSGSSTSVLLEVTSPGKGEGQWATVRAELSVPPHGVQGRAEVTVQKSSRSGEPVAFTAQELQGLSAIVRSANLTFSTKSGDASWTSGSTDANSPQGEAKTWSRSWNYDSSRKHGLEGASDIDSFIKEFDSQVFRPFMGGVVLGGMHNAMEELQRHMLQGHEEDDAENGEDEQAHTSPGPQVGMQGPGAGAHRHLEAPPPGGEQYDWGSPAATAAAKQLQALGCQVYPPGKADKMDWGILAGYEDQKRLLEDCLLLPLKRPEVYEALAKATRASPGSNRPRAVLFEGPPGTGKTTSARVISSQAAVPLVYLPLEAVLSKWYGESEGQLAKVFKAVAALGGAIVFIDELDALGGDRERGDLHEASRRLLSVLLREMDGFNSVAGARAVVIGATNRRGDLDAALLSRFDMTITFGLPDEPCRTLILAQYARQLDESQRATLSQGMPGLSGRDVRDVCEMAERRWASKIIRGEAEEGSLPPLAEYEAAARERVATAKSQQPFWARSVGLA